MSVHDKAVQSIEVVTRFPPSPTGRMHLGNARTALFNWLYARHTGGRFVLRIEDTDRERSTDTFTKDILESLKWMGLNWDGEVVYQSQRQKRHREIVDQLLEEGKAYQCYCTPQELESMREQAMKEGRPPRYDGRWRQKNPAEAPEGIAPTVRLKTPHTGKTVVNDLVQGKVYVQNDQMDDMVLQRSDGTPTYMLAVVVDDHDMGVTHIIRGDDHFTNAFRQTQLYHAMGWDAPIMAHIPLIHGQDGAKLSKRHGALSVLEYRDMGILPEALLNYLARLGWSHGNDEIFSIAQAINWFEMEALGKSAARFDLQKLLSLNAYYLKEKSADDLMAILLPRMEEAVGHEISALARARLYTILPALQVRAKTLVELCDMASVFVTPALTSWEEPATQEVIPLLAAFLEAFASFEPWTAKPLEDAVRAWTATKGMTLGSVAKPLRIAVTGKSVSPGLFEVLEAIGRDWVIARIGRYIKG